MFQGTTRQSRIDASMLLAETLGPFRCCVALRLKCQLSFHLLPCLHLKKQLSLRLIIPDFISLLSGFSPSLPVLLAVAFPALESVFICKVSACYSSKTPLRL